MEDTSQCHRFSVNNATLYLKLVVDIHSLCLSNNGVSVTAVPTATLCAIDCIHSPVTAMMTRMITIIPTINPIWQAVSFKNTSANNLTLY